MAAVLRKKYDLRVSRETTRLMLRQLDPVGVDLRRQNRLIRRTYFSRGPNETWHVDGYDKLSSYGFAISGYVQLKFTLNLKFVNETKDCRYLKLNGNCNRSIIL